jgi:NAD(P)-dependent dehydrogenase (short-subunit alcohol dehydrogenase family)
MTPDTGCRRLEGKRAIVTGGASGIGRAIAERLAAEGARVVVADLDAEGARGVAEALGPPALHHEVDVADAESVRALIARAVDEWGGLDVLVNNAGIGVAATVDETSDEDWGRIMAVSLTGVFHGMRAAVPVMRAQGAGSIVNISSVAALVGVAGRAAYCAAKGGVMALTRAAAVDHVGEGIRINCIAPGTVDTPWIERMTGGDAATRQAMQERQPHGRFVGPEEIAAMAAYLAADEAGSAVGAVMVVDGGMTAR